MCYICTKRNNLHFLKHTRQKQRVYLDPMLIMTYSYRISDLNSEEKSQIREKTEMKAWKRREKTHAEAGRMVEDMKTLEDL